MTNQQLAQIKAFAKPFYRKTGRYHGWDHIKEVAKHALHLSKEYPQTNLNVLLSACYLHDIGRSVKDEGHPEESVRLSKPFLKQLDVSTREQDAIEHAIVAHSRSKILSARTVEARLLFDADKLEILSVYGFLRVCLFLVEERRMNLSKAVNFLWKYVLSVRKTYLQTDVAKGIVDPELTILRQMVIAFNRWGEVKINESRSAYS